MKYPNRQKVKCLVCNQELGRLSHTHLKKHNLTINEYRDMFPNAEYYIPTEEEKILIKENHADITGDKNPFFGKTHSKETRQILSNKVKELWKDEEYRNDILEHRYCDGSKVRELYSFEFRMIKDKVYEEYGKKCNVCGDTKNLCIHHIDYDKQNNTLKNLIPLCFKCHGKTNFNREIWERLFKLDIFSFYKGDIHFSYIV